MKIDPLNIKLQADSESLKPFIDAVNKFSEAVEKATTVMQQYNMVLNKEDSIAFVEALSNTEPERWMIKKKKPVRLKNKSK